MKTYARIEAGTVVELLTTQDDITKLFHPALRWVAVDTPAVAVGWVEGPNGLAAPPPPPPQPAPPPPPPTLDELHARINELAAKVAALSPR